MTWLEYPQDEAEQLLRDGLDQAALRTGDEITHRRVWAKVADALLVPEPRTSGRLALVSAAALVVLLGAAGVIAFPYLSSRSHVTVAGGGSARAPAVTPPAPAEAPNPEATAPSAEQASQDRIEHGPGNVVRTRAGERARVNLGGGAVANLEENSAVTWDAQHRPAIQRGTAELSVPHQPPGWRFSVTAGPYVVTVVGTKFKVQVGGRSVGVKVDEGVVEVWRGSHSTRLVAGDSWHGPLYPEETSAQSTAGNGDVAARLAPAPAAAPSERPRAPSPSSALSAPPLVSASTPPAASRGIQDAEAALQSGDVKRALDLLGRAAQGSGPAAENAAYELARVTRYNLGRPRQAIALWDKYRTRFPAGLLRTEADLSIVDTLSQLGEVRAALDEAKAFLARHPNSERRGEVQRLIDRLRAADAASTGR